MIVDCAHYKDSARQHKGPLDLDEAAARRGEGFVWIGLHDPDASELLELDRILRRAGWL